MIMIRDCCCLCFTFGWRPAGFALLRVLPVFGLIPHIFWVSFAVCDLPWGILSFNICIFGISFWIGHTACF
jgi:hypothetical protein